MAVHKPGMVVHACNLSTWVVVGRRSGAQSHYQLRDKFSASLNFMILSLKTPSTNHPTNSKIKITKKIISVWFEGPRSKQRYLNYQKPLTVSSRALLQLLSPESFSAIWSLFTANPMPHVSLVFPGNILETLAAQCSSSRQLQMVSSLATSSMTSITTLRYC